MSDSGLTTVLAGRDAGLRRQLRTALTVAALALVLALGTAVVALVQTDRRIADVTEAYYKAVSEGDLGYLAVVEAEIGIRAYVATGDPVTLGSLESVVAGEQLTDELRETDVEAVLRRRLGPEHPVLRARAAAGEAVLDWYGGHAVPIIEAVEQGGPAAVTQQQLERSTVAFERFRTEMEEYLQLLRDQREEARGQLATWRTVMAVSVGLFALLAVVAGVVLWVVLKRWITEPLTRLADDARRVAQGDTDHVVSVTGRGEVGRVARDVELMRHELAGLYSQARSAREEVERSHALLQGQAEDLRRSNRDLEQFAYVASHDLQEPLRKVASFTQLLAKRYEGQLDERADQYIGFAVDGAKRMQRLINDLLGFSRVGRIGGEVSDVDLGAALERVKADLAETIEEAGAVVVGVDLPTVPGEEPLLTQLLQNLVANALKFRHPERTPEVRITARRDGGCWELACADNGIGIDPQYADRVFVIFQRLHAKDVYEGTGIGLALCKKIVEYHGGQIWIDPDTMEGTTIRWSLPVDVGTAPGTLGREGDPVPEAATAGGGRKDD